jgi:putative hydrolase of the HAD superfamily
MPVIQVVLFDLGGTLLHYERPPEHTFDAINARALSAFLDDAIKGGARVADVELAIRAVARMAAAMEAKAKRTNYANSAESIIRDGLDAIGVKVPEAAWDGSMAAYYESVSTAVIPCSTEIASVLRRLSEQGRQLGLVSNTLWKPELHDADLRRFGLLEYLPVRVYSSAAGFTKPDARIYRQALDRFDVAPAEAIFVGDKLAVDVAGPQKIGMRAVLVTSPYRTESDPNITPDAQVQSLAELPGLLDIWDHAIESQAGARG